MTVDLYLLIPAQRNLSCIQALFVVLDRNLGATLFGRTSRTRFKLATSVPPTTMLKVFGPRLGRNILAAARPSRHSREGTLSPIRLI